MTAPNTFPKYRWLVLAVVSLGIMACYMNIVSYAPLITQIASHFGIDAGKAMHLMSSTYIVTAIALFFAGVVCDKWGVKATLVAALLFSTVPACFVPFVQRFDVLMVIRVFQGIAPALVLVVVGPVAGRWFPPKQQGLASGLMMGALSLGAAAGLVIAPAIWERAGSWQIAVALLSALGWVVVVAGLFLRLDPPAEPEPADVHVIDSDSSSLFKKAIASPATWVATGVFFFSAWGLHSLYALVPAYLSAPSPAGVGLNPVLSGKLSLALTLVGILSVLVGGVCLDRVVKGNYRLIIAFGFGLTALSVYLVLLPTVYNSHFYLPLCLMLAGWGIPFTSSSTVAFTIARYPMTIVGRMLGTLGGLGTFGGAAGVYVGGVTVARTGTFNNAIAFIAIAAVLGCILSCFLAPRTKGLR